MFRLKNLKFTLSVFTFLVAICMFAMLQGFDLGQGPKGWIAVQTVGINDRGCVLVATNVDDHMDWFTMNLTGEIGGNGLYVKEELELKTKYSVTLCFENDGGNVQVIVKDGGYNERDAESLYSSPNACE